MKNSKLVKTLDEFFDLESDGYKPLIDWKHFRMPITLRLEIQHSLFGSPVFTRHSTVIANDKYYHYCWKNKIQVCEECCIPLYEYSAKFISHIISKGAAPEMAHDPRASRILCFDCHQEAEHETTHRMMKIFETDQIILRLLNYEYQIQRKNGRL